MIERGAQRQTDVPVLAGEKYVDVVVRAINKSVLSTPDNLRKLEELKSDGYSFVVIFESDGRHVSAVAR